jgi:hypothetical protein
VRSPGRYVSTTKPTVYPNVLSPGAVTDGSAQVTWGATTATIALTLSVTTSAGDYTIATTSGGGMSNHVVDPVSWGGSAPATACATSPPCVGLVASRPAALPPPRLPTTDDPKDPFNICVIAPDAPQCDDPRAPGASPALRRTTGLWSRSNTTIRPLLLRGRRAQTTASLNVSVLPTPWWRLRT